MVGVYRFAELNIAVRSLFGDVHDYCAEFHTDAEADFAVGTSAEDIAFERTRAAASDAALGRPSRAYTDGYLEELAVYRKIAERLPLYDTVLFHGSALAADGEGYLFTAPSGTGKSTLLAIIAGALEEIDPDRAAARLEKVLETKWKTLADDPQGRLKLIRFALSRGYDYEPVRPLIERITAPR